MLHSALTVFDISSNQHIINLCISIFLSLLVILIGAAIDFIEQKEINLFSRLTNHKIAYFLCNYATFVGTIIHEYSHAMFGTLTGAKVTNIKCFEFSGGRLGHVEFIPTGNKLKQSIQLAAIGCAPVVMGLIIEDILIKCFLCSTTTAAKIILGYLILSVFNHMSMSKSDIKNYTKGLWVILPILFLLLTVMQMI